MSSTNIKIINEVLANYLELSSWSVTKFWTCFGSASTDACPENTEPWIFFFFFSFFVFLNVRALDFH